MTDYYTPTKQWLERKIRHLIAQGSGLNRDHVRPAHGDGPTGKNDFAILNLISDERSGQPYYDYRDSRLKTFEFISENRSASYDATFFGEKAYEYANKFNIWIFSGLGILAQLQQTFDSKKIVQEPCIVVKSSEIRQNDTIVHTKHEMRAVLSLEVDYKRVARHDVGWYDKLDIGIHHSEIQGIDSTIPNETIEVSENA